jgi:type II secretory pathway pseudopilin PulG
MSNVKSTNRIHHLARQRQGGFAIAYVLVAVALIGVMFAFFSRSSNSATPQATLETSRINAASVIKIGTDLREAAVRYGAVYNLASMTLDTTTGTGLYDPALGLATHVGLPAQAFASGTAGDFAVNTAAINVTGLGTTGAEIAITLSGVSAQVCSGVNNILYGDTFNTTIPSSVGSRMEGCATLTIGTTSSNVYYKVIQGA